VLFGELAASTGGAGSGIDADVGDTGDTTGAGLAVACVDEPSSWTGEEPSSVAVALPGNSWLLTGTEGGNSAGRGAAPGTLLTVCGVSVCGSSTTPGLGEGT
jgi:hypothetical protein